MIAEELRQAIRVLKDQGRPLREISRALKVSRNTVRRVLREDQRPKAAGVDPRVQAIAELLPDLYRDCKGNAVRIGEVLNEVHGIAIAYSTLTRLIREHTDLRTPKKRSGTYTFGPGEEMQHDTSPHRVTLGGKAVNSQCASLVLAYSRMLFVQYYPRFTRFEGPVTVAVTGKPAPSLGPDLARLIGRLRSEAGIDIRRVSQAVDLPEVDHIGLQVLQ